ncbi:response regulator [Granulicella aggregans]|nr:response regulator [Granulicella aggregans]
MAEMAAKTCLVVDDSPTVRKVARRFLRHTGLDIQEAENGQIALDQCTLKMPDVILLDWNMPVMSGIQFLRHLRAASGGTEPKVIFCTTESDVDHIREAFEAGTDEYLMKPFDAKMLNDKLGNFFVFDHDPSA